MSSPRYGPTGMIGSRTPCYHDKNPETRRVNFYRAPGYEAQSIYIENDSQSKQRTRGGFWHKLEDQRREMGEILDQMDQGTQRMMGTGGVGEDGETEEGGYWTCLITAC
jgi:hypothetical protein